MQWLTLTHSAKMDSKVIETNPCLWNKEDRVSAIKYIEQELSCEFDTVRDDKYLIKKKLAFYFYSTIKAVYLQNFDRRKD